MLAVPTLLMKLGAVLRPKDKLAASLVPPPPREPGILSPPQARVTPREKRVTTVSFITRDTIGLSEL